MFCWYLTCLYQFHLVCGSVTICYPFHQLPDYLTYFSYKSLARAKPSQKNTNCNQSKCLIITYYLCSPLIGLIVLSPLSLSFFCIMVGGHFRIQQNFTNSLITLALVSEWYQYHVIYIVELLMLILSIRILVLQFVSSGYGAVHLVTTSFVQLK